LTFSDFFDRIGNLDWLAVLVGALIFMVIGWLWYGPLFGKQWAKMTGTTAGSMAPDKLIWTFVYSFVLSGAVNYFGVLDDVEHALVTAILLGVLLISAAAYSLVVWENRKPGLWLIDLLYIFVSIAVVTYVQGLMA
jgi:hypothetical protein